MTDLFEQIDIKTPVILLVDASGSTLCNFDTKITVIDKIEEIVKNINSDQFRVLFWNSDKKDNQTNFLNGIIRPMHVINKSSLRQLFFLAKTKITQNCLTFSHLAFKSIPKEWINSKEPTHIYFITDGQIGYRDCDYYNLFSLKSQFKSEFEKIFKENNNIHLHIITVEPTTTDFGAVETLNTCSGSDIFKIIQSNGLTKYVTEFTSYSPNNQNGYKHINTMICPPSFIPFGNNCFSETKTHKFMKFLHNLIQNSKEEEELLKIVQNLSATIKALIKDKPKNMADSIMNTFCNMFNSNKILDSTIVRFILVDTIKLEEEGKSIVFSQYRAKLKDLYKQAQELLLQNTKNAMNINNKFISMPIDGKIISGPHNLVTESITLSKKTYPRSAVTINKLSVPVLPYQTIPLPFRMGSPKRRRNSELRLLAQCRQTPRCKQPSHRNHEQIRTAH